MANPKRKISRSKRDKRRANWTASIKTNSLINCDNCSEKKLRHVACPNCGYYKGKSVFIPDNA